MPKPFTWIVSFTVDKEWVADGFSLNDSRAHDMLTNELSFARGDEVQAKVLNAPSPLAVARAQGYDKKHPDSGRIVRELMSDIPEDGKVYNALVAAIKLLDSVAFVAKEGDTAKPLEKLRAALELVSPTKQEELTGEPA